MAPLLLGRFTFPVPFGRFMVPALPGLPVVDSDLPVFGLPPMVVLFGLLPMVVAFGLFPMVVFGGFPVPLEGLEFVGVWVGGAVRLGGAC